jgi:hypothetical protein
VKLNELITDFTIATTNEERDVLDKMSGVTPIDAFDERDQFIIENLIRKSLVSKVKHKGIIMVLVNEAYR